MVKGRLMYKLFIGLVLIVFSCSGRNEKQTESKPKPGAVSELPFLKLPDGAAITVYASDVENARSLALSDDGTLYVGTRSKGNVYALKDTDGDNKADVKYTLARGLKMPNGVALKNGDLYVAEVSRILKFSDIERNLKDDADYEVIYDDYPTKTHHGWKYIAFGPDGKLYVPVGAPCNICESEEIFTTITRMKDDGSNMEIVHTGIRNTVGFSWHPKTNDLWFTDNGGDMLGDDVPGDELNHAPQDGLHFGYPYCHQGNVPDPKFGDKRDCDEFTPPAQILGPHVAALGMEFYKGGNFPAKYKNSIFIAEHGSWNRSVPIGYRITRVELDGNKAVNYEVFIDGFRDNRKDELHGRPVDLEWMPDGSLLISDDYADRIYRMSFN